MFFFILAQLGHWIIVDNIPFLLLGNMCTESLLIKHEDLVEKDLSITRRTTELLIGPDSGQDDS